MGHYIPVTWLSFGLDYTLWGMNPFGYHLTNNLIHAANTALFYLIALRLLGKASTPDGRHASRRRGDGGAVLRPASAPRGVGGLGHRAARRPVRPVLPAHHPAVPGRGRRRRRAAAAAPGGISDRLCPGAPVEVDRHDIAARPALAGRLPARPAAAAPGHVARGGDPGALEGEAPVSGARLRRGRRVLLGRRVAALPDRVGQVRLARPDRDRGVQRLVLPREDRRAAGAVAALRAPAHREPARRALPVEHRRRGRHQPGPPGAPPPLAGGARRVDLLRHLDRPRVRDRPLRPPARRTTGTATCPAWAWR